MTYSLQSVTSWQDVIDEIVIFAAARGWTTTTSPDTIANPSTGLVTTLSTTGDYLTLSPAGGVDARCRLPWLNGTYAGSPVEIQPVQCHMFGNNSPYLAPDTEPYIGVSVGFGFNSYRQLYIGTLVASGNYTDGDVIACNDFSQNYVDIYPEGSSQRYLFRAYNTHVDQVNNGGAKITHLDNATTWRAFNSPYTNSGNDDPYNSLLGGEVYGGNGDGVNDGLVYRAHADFASGQIMVPVNLYCSDGNDGTNFRIRPLGHVSGVRLIDMENIAPEQQLSISADNWRAFPEFSKRSESFMDWSAIGTTVYWPYEYSHFYGVAYRENA